MTSAASLSYDRTGAGAPIVILHGLFGAKRNWQSIARKLASQFTVFTVDMRNHGDSPRHARMDYATLAADIGALLDTLNLEGVTLIGHSMGGKAAMTYALTDAARLSRLVIVDIAPRAYPNEYGTMLAGMARLDLGVTKNRTAADAALRQYIPEETIRSFILQSLRFRSGAAFEWQINIEAIAANIDALVGAIPVATTARFARPSFFIRGENSDRIGAADFVTIAHHFPDYTDIAIAAAGHWPHAENPAGFLQALQQILANEPI